MKGLKNRLIPAMFAVAGVLSLVPALLGPVNKGKPLNTVYLVIACMFFVFAVVFFAAGRKSGGRGLGAAECLTRAFGSADFPTAPAINSSLPSVSQGLCSIFRIASRSH